MSPRLHSHLSHARSAAASACQNDGDKGALLIIALIAVPITIVAAVVTLFG